MNIQIFLWTSIKKGNVQTSGDTQHGTVVSDATAQPTEETRDVQADSMHVEIAKLFLYNFKAICHSAIEKRDVIMKKYFFRTRIWVAVFCAMSLLFSSVASAARPDNIYITTYEKLLWLQYNAEYLTMKINGYYPLYNAPHYQLVLSPGFIYKEKVYFLEEIGENVFANNTFSQIYVYMEHGLSIEPKAFYNIKVQNVASSSVTDHAVEFEGNSVTNIGQYAFAEMQVADRFKIENLTGSIGVRAFENATVRGALTINGQIGTLGAGAFSGTFAREWKLTEEIQRIEEGAFQKSNIEEFTIGESVKYMGSKVFKDSDLARLYLPSGNFRGEVAQDAIPDKEGLTIVISDGDTDLSVFHFENFQNAVFEVPSDLDEDSAVMQFLKEHQLKWQRADKKPVETNLPATPTPGEGDGTPAPEKSDAPATTAPAEGDGTPAPEESNTPATPVPEESNTPATPAPEESNAPATPVPGGDSTPAPTENGTQGTPVPTGGKLPAASPGSVGTLQDDKGKKDFVSKKIKYRVTANNQVSVQGASDRKLIKLTIPDTVTYQGRLYKVTAIKKKAFYSYANLKQVYIGNYVKNVGAQAFSKCTRLRNISFGRKVTTLGAKVLYQAHSVKRVTFQGKLLKKIGKQTFRGVPKSVRFTAPKTRAEKYKKLIVKAK